MTLRSTGATGAVATSLLRTATKQLQRIAAYETKRREGKKLNAAEPYNYTATEPECHLVPLAAALGDAETLNRTLVASKA